jgi:hypothetical protein
LFTIFADPDEEDEQVTGGTDPPINDEMNAKDKQILSVMYTLPSLFAYFY